MKNVTDRICTLLLIAYFGSATGCRRTNTSPNLATLKGVVEFTLKGQVKSAPYFFSDISGMAFDSAGRLAIIDGRANLVRIFSAKGLYQFTYGEPGSSTPVLRDPCCASLASHDSLWLFERGARRYSAIRLGSYAATYISSVTAPSEMSGLATRVNWDSHGRLVHISDSVSGADNQFRLVRYFLAKSGVVGHDMLPSPPTDSVEMVSLNSAAGKGITGVTRPFGARALWAFGPNGETAGAVSSRYAVSWFDVKQQRIHLLQQSVEAPRTSRHERLRAEETLDALARNVGVPRTSIPFQVPARKAVLQNLGFDLDGRLWVELSVPEGAPKEADVYDRTGKLIGRMRWPARVSLELWTASGRTAFGVSTDDLGSQTVSKLRFQQ